MVEDGKRCRHRYHNSSAELELPESHASNEEHSAAPNAVRDLPYLYQVITDSSPFVNLGRKMHWFSATRNPKVKNGLNERDNGYGSEHIEDEKAGNKLEPIPYMNRENDHEEFASGTRIC